MSLSGDLAVDASCLAALDSFTAAASAVVVSPAALAVVDSAALSPPQHAARLSTIAPARAMDTIFFLIFSELSLLIV